MGVVSVGRMVRLELSMTDEPRCPQCRSPRVHSAENDGVVKWYAGSLVGVRYCPFCGHDLLQPTLGTWSCARHGFFSGLITRGMPCALCGENEPEPDAAEGKQND